MDFGAVSVLPKADGSTGVSAFLAARLLLLRPGNFYGLWSPRFERLEAALAMTGHHFISLVDRVKWAMQKLKEAPDDL